jgi:hypothetical protein
MGFIANLAKNRWSTMDLREPAKLVVAFGFFFGSFAFL